MSENEEKNNAEEQADSAVQEQTEPTLFPKRPKRNGKFVNKLASAELEAMQRKKSLFMYLSTLFFAVSLFLKVEGRAKLSENKSLFALFTLYVIGLLALIVLSVYISLKNRLGQKIDCEISEKETPRSGLDKHTFISYEIFNALHMLMAAAEIAISIYSFGVWGAFNIVAAIASAVFCLLSRNILFKANAGNLEYIPWRDESQEEKHNHSKKRTTH